MCSSVEDWVGGGGLTEALIRRNSIEIQQHSSHKDYLKLPNWLLLLAGLRQYQRRRNALFEPGAESLQMETLLHISRS